MSWLQGVWSWVAGHWPWFAGSGVLIAVVAFAVMNPLAAVKLASTVSGFLLDAMRALVEWLRRPGNKLKAACAVLAMVAAVACLTSYQTNRRYIVVTRERDAAVGERDTAVTAAAEAKSLIGQLEASLATYREQEQEYADLQRQQSLDLLQAQQENAAALAMISKQRADAERSSRAWWQAYAKRPDSCKAAQEAMDVACATVGEF
ncbi:hypothetical protein [Lysobacter sp. Root96]|uniref:hypothetical protein n=1 Tax=Lysobacter sp. Root96 TaxID=1736612 RepID=UPI0006FB6B34|nr:hypothetical protein [Lysobacter sp. Root96]KRD71433.1 hypothetical protein ASE45_06385 [Lysobacter sp. Root96]